ncbi:MAG: fimbrillin family protein [Alistipes sp.]|nr:fimbrillin family protein [Alistipes sp.]
MKKLFVAVLAVAALASCAQEDVILNNNKAITFGDAYVANSTKAIYEGAEEVEAFQVWGTVTGTEGTVALYNGANVTRPDGKAYGDAWTCDVQRFWTPNCKYAFYAVVDADAVTAVDANSNPTGVPTSITYTADGTTDLLYGATTRTTGDAVSDPGVVAFTMQHLLSKVSFKFTNTNTNAAYTYKVTNVVVSGAYASGTYTIDHKFDVDSGLPTSINGTYAGAWGSYSETMPALSFLNGALTLENATVNADKTVTASTATAPKSFVIIPGAPALSIAIEVQTVFNSKVVSTQPYNLTVNTTEGAGGDDTDITFEKNTHYNFVVALEGGKPIDFTIGSVGDFVTPDAGGDVTIQ